MSLFKSPQTVLMISDEALYIYVTGARSVRLVETVSWDMPTFVDTVSSILRKDCGGKPILFLNDTVEQHYRKERIPRVSVMDRANVIQRRLKVAFPNYQIRAALPLKEKAPKSKEGRANDLFIFGAVPRSEEFAKAMQAVQRSFCSISGYGLLPVESSDLVSTLSARLTPRNKKKAVWAMLLGQHQSGGLRQIVTKNGELALTRMTPLSEDHANPGVWAHGVYQEFKATMSYLSRFGFAPEDGLDVIAITTPQAGEAIADLLVEDGVRFYPLSAREAAKYAGIPAGHQEGPHYSDALHVGWAGRKARLILPMQAQEIESVSKPRRAAAFISLALLLGAGVQGYQFLGVMQALDALSADLQAVQLRQAKLDDEYKAEVERKQALGFDIELIQASTEIYEGLRRKEIPALNLVQAMGRALGRDLRMDQLIVERMEQNMLSRLAEKLVSEGEAVPYDGATYFVSFQMTFPSTTDIDRGNKEVSDLRDRLAVLLPDHVVKVDKYLKDYEFVDELVVETGVTEETDVSQDFIASIRIERAGS